MTRKKRLAIIGAGPSGLAVAWGLAEQAEWEVTILESSSEVGGLSRTLERHGLRFDIGPHRLSAQLPEMLTEVQTLLGDDLEEKENHHAVYIHGMLYRYPPCWQDFLNPTSVRNTVLFGGSWLMARAKSAFARLASFAGQGPQTFDEILLNAFGHRFCTTVIFPMIKKVWGTRDLHADFARIRFQLPTVVSFILRFFSKRARLNSRYFYYPVNGFGAIWQRIGRHIGEHGHRVVFSATIRRIKAESLQGPFQVYYLCQGVEDCLEADLLVSTISNRDLLGYLHGIPGAQSATREIENFPSRTLRLGLMLVRNFHLATRVVIFPEEAYIFNRISEMNQFADLGYPADQALLMVDVIMDRESPYHDLPDQEFERVLLESVLALGWFKEEDVCRMFSIKVPDAYPVLEPRRYEAQERVAACFADTNILLCGREASTDYNNAHNAIAKGFMAARYITGAISREEFAESAAIIGRLPIQD